MGNDYINHEFRSAQKQQDELVAKLREDPYPPDEMAKHKRATALQAIRRKCCECSGGSRKEVRLCVIPDCALFPFRMGENYWKAKRKPIPAAQSGLQRGSEAKNSRQKRGVNPRAASGGTTGTPDPRDDEKAL